MTKRTTAGRVLSTAAILLALAALMLPGSIQASNHEESAVAAEIKALIMEANAFTNKNLRDPDGGVSKDGSLQFWSSGGLIQWVAPDSSPSDYDHSSIVAKHIEVIELPGGEAAAAMYYAEGSFQVKGMSAVDHYMTRVLEIYVKEDGKWVSRASHWSPIAAGSGTNQSSVD